MIKHICPKGLLIALSVFIIAGCSTKNQEALVLWTDNVEFASYVELYNSSQNEVKIATVYKTSMVNELPAKKGGQSPDLLAGSYLGYGMKKNLYSPLNKIFTEEFTEEVFYPGLLEAGIKKEKQVLLPVSFNLGMLVFDVANSDLVDCQNTISFDQIKNYSKNFNTRSKDEIYTKMAFAPQWNTEFLYKVLAINGLNFIIDDDELQYNTPVLENSCRFISSWTNEINTSYNDEKDFSFKYLYTPYNKQVLQQKSLFAYTTSNKLLALSEDQLDKIDFRWLSENGKAPVEDNMAMIGIYRKSKNKKAALKFIQWFLSEEAQEEMIKRRLAMNLDTNTFGIAGGFSSLIAINERVLPIYYKCLLARTPSNSIPQSPFAYSTEWTSVKKEIITPYLLKELSGEKESQTLPQLFKEWVNQNKEE